MTKLSWISIFCAMVATQQACPTMNDTCRVISQIMSPNSPFAPPCWTSYEDTWECELYFDQETKTCLDTRVDVTTCGYPVAVPTCPTSQAICIMQDMVFGAMDPFAPNCWFPRQDGNYECHALAEWDASKGLIDIHSCFPRK